MSRDNPHHGRLRGGHLLEPDLTRWSEAEPSKGVCDVRITPESRRRRMGR